MKKLIDWIRKYIGWIGFTLAVIGMFFTVIYNTPDKEELFLSDDEE